VAAAEEHEPAALPSDEDFVSYEQWGADFFKTAISGERILGAVDNVAGQPIDFGPIGVGPGKIAKVRAYGAIGSASATRIEGREISYRVELPVDLTFELDLQVETHTFHADLLVPLTLTARAVSGVRVYIEVVPPRTADVQVQVRADGLRASIVQRVANIESELRRFVARYVAREVAKPHIQAARLIDVAGAIDRAWATIAPESARPAVADDLNEALESEIRENEDTFLEL
jgi:hypothetical protein